MQAAYLRLLRAGVVFTTFVIIAYFVSKVKLGFLYRRLGKKLNKMPKKWKKVGEVTALNYYLLKSGAAHKTKEFSFHHYPELEMLNDRCFMIVDENRRFVSARDEPKLGFIQMSFNVLSCTLKADNKDDVTILLYDAMNKPKIDVEVLDQTVQVYDCGDVASQWLSTLIVGTSESLRLVLYHSPAGAATEHVKLELDTNQYTEDNIGAMYDPHYCRLVNESSVEQLNRTMHIPVSADWFRPNIVVNGLPAFAEDKIGWIKIGSAVLHVAEMCPAKMFFMHNPVKCWQDKEALEAFGKYRDTFGVHLEIVDPKQEIQIGDSVFIEE